MRWLILIIFALIFSVLEQGWPPFLSFGAGDVQPWFLMILMVYVAMFAPPLTIAWAAIFLGLLVDLTHPHDVGDPPQFTAILGPFALGFLLGGLVTYKLRSLVFRDSAFTLAAMTFIAGLFVAALAVLLLRLRAAISFTNPVVNFSTTKQLVRTFLCLLYSAGLSIPIGFVLLKFRHAFGFHAPAKSHR